VQIVPEAGRQAHTWGLESVEIGWPQIEPCCRGFQPFGSFRTLIISFSQLGTVFRLAPPRAAFCAAPQAHASPPYLRGAGQRPVLLAWNPRDLKNHVALRVDSTASACRQSTAVIDAAALRLGYTRRVEGSWGVPWNARIAAIRKGQSSRPIAARPGSGCTALPAVWQQTC